MVRCLVRARIGWRVGERALVPAPSGEIDMGKRTNLPGRRGFLRALGRCGNVRMAAEEAGVGRSWLYRVRREEPAFAAEWEAAVAGFDSGLVASDSPLPNPSPAEGRGASAVVLRGNKFGRVQVAAARENDWTPEREEVFLGELGATCNVSASARAAGLSPKGVYARRRKWPAFASAWDEALTLGFVRLEAKLVRQATNGLRPPDGDAVAARIAEADDDAAIMDTSLAINLLKQHEAAVRGTPGRRRGAAQAQEPRIEDVRDRIVAKLDALKRARERGC